MLYNRELRGRGRAACQRPLERPFSDFSWSAVTRHLPARNGNCDLIIHHPRTFRLHEPVFEGVIAYRRYQHLSRLTANQ